MANTYSQIYIQVVFAVEARQYLVRPEFKEEVQKYVTGITTERGQKLLAVHCMPDHTHMLIGLKPSMALSDLVRDIKNGASNFIIARAGSFREEYLRLLKRFEINHEEQFIFKDVGLEPG